MSSAIVPVYARADVAFERGDGCWLTSTTGERYLDFGAGIAVASLGYSHPHLVEALTTQAGKLWHTSNLFQMPDGERLAHRLPPPPLPAPPPFSPLWRGGEARASQ